MIGHDVPVTEPEDSSSPLLLVFRLGDFLLEHVMWNGSKEAQRQYELARRKLPPKKKSRKCKKKAIAAPKSFTNYAEYIQSRAWRHKREEAFKYHGRSCNSCKATDRPFHVHHKTYERLGNERMADLEILCEQCHAVEHDRMTDVLSREFREVVG